MFQGREVIAIIGAGGLGRRMGSSVPKQFHEIDGSPILQITVGRFFNMELIDRVVVICPKDYMKETEDILPAGIEIVKGGSERRDSIYAGILHLARTGAPPDSIVLVHDGVRPFVTPRVIEGVTEAAASSGAAICAVAATETVRHAEEGTLDRSKLYNVQTPQGFRFSILKEAYDKACEDGFLGTDDAGLVERLGITVDIVEGDPSNIKITRQEDLACAPSSQGSAAGSGAPTTCAPGTFRVGTGFDVHRLEEGRKLILGGVEVPFEKGLSGYSDADVLVHAIMDALLGAAAMGDIGKLFPDSDPEYEGASSLALLEEVVGRVRCAGYDISNVDSTVICQKPKLAGYIPEMIDRIAGAMGLDSERVSIKATTTEKLGFTGRGEGIAAEAIALLAGS